MRLILSILLAFSTLFLSAQSFDSTLKKLSSQYPQEKLHLHFDRDVYNAGETAWFKAYLFSGSFPSQLSKTIYAELVDEQGQVLQQLSMPVMMASASSAFEIPASASGSVFVRAYTKWMLNFDSSFLYTKAIPVIAKQKPLDRWSETNSKPANNVRAVKNTQAKPATLHFFPEGGDLVTGVDARVAFKATDSHGIPVSVNGEIIGSNGSAVSTFTSVHDGMGTFRLLPLAGEQYKAVWKYKGQQYETPLPAAKPSGIGLEAANIGNKIAFTIRRSEETLPYNFVYIVAQMNQGLLFRGRASTTKTEAVGSFSIENLPAGIVQLTIFTPHEIPLAERLLFIQPSQYTFAATLQATETSTGKRGKNVLEIEVPDTLLTNLSITVTDAELNPSRQGDNIYSSLLLTSDIRGYVHNPAYYFSGNDDKAATYLDLVMMTNGWRRFKWENVLTGRFPKLRYQPENYIAIEGLVKGLDQKQLTGKELTGVLELRSRQKQYFQMPVQPNGVFRLGGLVFFDTAKLYYQFNNDKNKSLTARAKFVMQNDMLDKPLGWQPNALALALAPEPEPLVFARNKAVIEQQVQAERVAKEKMMQTVTVSTTRKKTKEEEMDAEYTSGAFAGNLNSRTLIVEDDPSFLGSQSILTYLHSRVAGLQINAEAVEDAIYWRGHPTSLFIDEISQRTLGEDGKIIESAGYLLSLNMSEVAMIKIFEPPFVGAWGNGAGGAISVYLKKAGRNLSKGLDFIQVPGYSPLREFYSPDYSIVQSTDAADYRRTLYWNPFIITNKENRKVTLPFYNNDITQKMKVVLEGFNEEGKLIRIEKLIQ
ncbi:MAG TPA: hypothetical protein VMR70_06475 [Flavisolibacter sp.]|nr:hypothetical protein [Flavisolibacter sp.]